MLLLVFGESEERVLVACGGEAVEVVVRLQV